MREDIGEQQTREHMIYLSVELLTMKMQILSLYPLGVLEETVVRQCRCLANCLHDVAPWDLVTEDVESLLNNVFKSVQCASNLLVRDKVWPAACSEPWSGPRLGDTKQKT